MKKKFFSLLHSGSIHVAPQTKIIPAQEFSKALESIELIAEVKSDALKYKQTVAEEAEIIKQQAAKEGFEEGFKQWMEKIAQVENELVEAKTATEKAAFKVAMASAKKIVEKELEVSPETIIDIIKKNLKAVVTHRRITIYVNKNDLETLEKNRNKIKDFFEQLEVLSIREKDDIEPGGCVIETEGGIINARLEHQWTIIEKAFEKMMNREK